MQPIRLHTFLTTTSICAALLLTAGCDEGEPSLDLIDNPIVDPSVDPSDNPSEDPSDELPAADDFAPPPAQPEAPIQLTEKDGMLIIEGGDYLVRIHRTRRVAELNVSRDQLAKWYAIPFSRWAPEASRRLYQVFADDFDFIVFVPASEGQHPALTEDGTSVRVSNHVEGLGLAQFDHTDWYGSEGRLQSTVLLGGIKHVVSGPSLRELGERWGNTFVPSDHVDHFGFSDVGGQLGGCSPDQIKPLGHGRWFCDFNGTVNWSPDGATSNDRPYARLELYLMGLIGPEAVPPFTWADQGKWVDPNLGVFEGILRTATIDEARQIHGKRLPAHDEAQKQFRTLFVVVSGGPLIDNPMFHSFDGRVAELAAPYPVVNEQPGMHNFYEATSGLATLDAEDLDASLR